MYNHHFGFREKPFQLVPNPAYLFLSKSHEEALAHLNYAMAQGDGFVEITGEVGTGKTTLIRAFIEGLEPGIEVAYIFNPKLDAVELLEAIHDELGIAHDAGASAKTLIDTLNGFLLEKKAEGEKVLLIIDEAQHLERAVLEQIRLLSNLETHTEKLLQIVLVGQPELAEMLGSYELRQLGQRITLSASLTPLSFRDTVRYIQHRLHLAAQGANVPFTRWAYRIIFRYSRGIPRLIHIVCDRALLVAYVLDRDRITGPIVKTAIRELAGRVSRIPGPRTRFQVPMLLFVALVAVTVGFLGLRAGGFHFIAPQPPSDIPQKLDAPKIASKILDAPQNKTPKPDEKISPETVPDTPSTQPLPYVERRAALTGVLSLWGRGAVISADMESPRNDPAFFDLATESNGFELLRVEGDITLIETLNLPAILSCYVPEANTFQYLVLSRIQGSFMTFLGTDATQPALIEKERVTTRWSGVAYIPWLNFLDCRGTLPINANKQSILILKQLLRDIGFEDISPGADFDGGVETAVKRIQAKYGLEVDGLVGSLTKILLYNEKADFGIPHLQDKGKDKG